MLPEGLLAALGGVAYLICFVIALYIYVALVRQIGARVLATEGVPVKTFGAPEAVLAFALISLFLLGVRASSGHAATQLSDKMILENLLVTVASVLFIVALLSFRGLDLNSLAGFSKIGFVRAIVTGFILLLAAYPLVMLADS